MQSSNVTGFRCTGWWEQDFYGRQPMRNLQLTLTGDSLQGSGWDIIGPFKLTGEITGGNVVILKQYLGRHQVQYLGTYDGEGVLAGEWRIGEWGGRWLISLTPSSDVSGAEIETLE